MHGSLARAGKVRGQTPKVPKQDKKKKPTGRACKRLKYNRRFVNVGASPEAVGLWCSGGESHSPFDVVHLSHALICMQPYFWEIAQFRPEYMVYEPVQAMSWPLQD